MRPGVRKYYENLRAIFSAVPDSYAEHLPRLKIIEDTLGNLPYEKFFRDQAVFGDYLLARGRFARRVQPAPIVPQPEEANATATGEEPVRVQPERAGIDEQLQNQGAIGNSRPSSRRAG